MSKHPFEQMRELLESIRAEHSVWPQSAPNPLDAVAASIRSTLPAIFEPIGRATAQLMRTLQERRKAGAGEMIEAFIAERIPELRQRGVHLREPEDRRDVTGQLAAAWLRGADGEPMLSATIGRATRVPDPLLLRELAGLWAAYRAAAGEPIPEPGSDIPTCDELERLDDRASYSEAIQAAEDRVRLAYLWPEVLRGWCIDNAAELAARGVVYQLANAERPDPIADCAAEGRLAQAIREALPDARKTVAIPETEAELAALGERDGMFALDAAVCAFIAGRGGAGIAKAEEMRDEYRQRWREAAAPRRDAWSDPLMLARTLASALWSVEVRAALNREQDMPPGLTAGVFSSVVRLTTTKLSAKTDDRGQLALFRPNMVRPAFGAPIAVADYPTLPTEVLDLKALGNRHALPFVEMLVWRAHQQALAGDDGSRRPDCITLPAWDAVTAEVLGIPVARVHPDDRRAITKLARMLANTPVRWADGARSSSLFHLEETPKGSIGRGRGHSVNLVKLSDRLLLHEVFRAPKRMPVDAMGPEHWENIRIVPLVRPRVIPMLPKSPRDTFGPQTVFVRHLWLYFTQRGFELLSPAGLVALGRQARSELADAALLPARLVDPLLEWLGMQHVIEGDGVNFAPSDRAAQEFIKDGWRNSEDSSVRGKAGSAALKAKRAARRKQS